MIRLAAFLTIAFGFTQIAPSFGSPPPAVAPSPSTIHDLRSASSPLSPHPFATTSEPGDELWWDGFALPAIDGWVNAVAQFQNRIVIAGRFTQVGGVPATNLAAWDGSRWEPLGHGPNEDVMCLAVYRGELIAGGRFQTIGGTEALGIARWDGFAWSPLGEGLSAVNGLLVQDDLLLAAGEFTRAGALVVNHVAQWDGISWSALGEGVAFAGSALGRFNGDVFVGGEFHSLSSPGASGLARWDGAGWHSVPVSPPGEGPYHAVRAFVPFAGGLVVGGYFDEVGGIAARNVAIWNGSNWDSIGSGVPGYVFSLAAHEDSLRVAGSLSDAGYFDTPAVETWTGGEWIPWQGLHGQAICLLPTPQGLIAGGVLVSRDDQGVPRGTGVLRSSSSGWTAFEPWSGTMHGLLSFQGTRSDVVALAPYQGEVLAAGHFALCGAPPGYTWAAGLATWDGNEWHPLPWHSVYDPPQVLHVEADTIHAGGYFDSWYGPKQPVPVLRFDGHSWSPFDTLSLAVTGITRYQGDLYIAGRRASLDSPPLGGVYRWNGSRWETVGLAQGGDFPGVNAMAVFQGKLVAGGDFDHIGGIPAQAIAAWDGNHWAAIDPAPLLEGIRDLVIHDTDLIAAASVTQGSEVLRYDGKSWIELGVIRSVVRLGNVEGQLFAGGWLYQPGWDMRPNGVARWDGHEWKRLGSGTNEIVREFLSHDGHVYMAGWFTQAGGKSSFGMARWDGLSTLQPREAPSALVGVAPNPFRESVSFQLRIRDQGAVLISVHDLHGRELAVLARGSLAPGNYPMTWNGRDHTGARVASGIYFVRLSGPGDRKQGLKIVHIR
jgi:hypothetical protein